MTNIDRTVMLHNTIVLAKHDEVTQFMLQHERDQLDALRKSNLDQLFDLARQCKVRYIYIGLHEICGCEGVSYNSSPAMWYIARKMGFVPSAGNSDQYQCMHCSVVFPADAYGGWDLLENKKLDPCAVKSRQFFHVVGV